MKVIAVKIIRLCSGVSRHGAQGARAPPLALAKHNILYSWNSDNTASAPPWLLSIIVFDLEQLRKQLQTYQHEDKSIKHE